MNNVNVKNTARQQIMRKVNASANTPAAKLWSPSDGWIATIRKTLGMSGAELGRRLNLKRGRISQAEKAELEGGVSLRTMERMAEGLGCRFVYAIIPEDGGLEDVIRAQAHKKAKEIVNRAATHMALEKQSIGHEKNLGEIKRLTDEFARAQPSGFWD